MFYLDFTQIYPALASFLFVLSGLYAVLFEQKSYAKRQLFREAVWTKRIGWTCIVFGVCLYITGYIWRSFIW